MSRLMSGAPELDILFGPAAAVSVGLSTSWNNFSSFAVNNPQLENIDFVDKCFYYRPSINRSLFLTEGVWREQKCLLPTRERVVVDYIQNQDVIDEGELCMAIDYYAQYTHEDLSKLYEAAIAMGSSKEEVDHWLYEARVVGY